MAIESICEGCGKRLTVGDDFAHKQARCPSCGHIYAVSALEGASSSLESPDQGGTAAESAPAAAQTADDWYLHSPEGRIYGPIDQSKLDQWVREGRVTHDCQLRQRGDGPWQWASAVYGVLAKHDEAVSAGTGNPFAGGLSSAVAAGSGDAPTRPCVYAEPHRGALVLVLGILSFVITCPILGIVAWWMGNDDLKAMSRGRMDPSGSGITQAGRVLGMISTILWMATLAVSLFLLLLFGFVA
jgi:hypothetical protein